MRIRTKILFFLILLVVFAIIEFMFISFREKKVINVSDKLIKIYLPTVSYVNEYRHEILTSKLLTENLVNSREFQEKNKEYFFILMNNLIPALEDSLLDFAKRIDTSLEKKLILIYDKTNKLLENEGKIISQQYMQLDSLDLERSKISLISIDTLATSILINLQKVSSYINGKKDANLRELNDVIEKNKIVLFTVRVVYIFVVIILSFILIQSIVSQIKYLKRIIEDLGLGKLPKSKLKETKDEIGEMSRVLNKFISNLKKTAAFAIEIGEKNFEKIDFQPLSEYDELGKTLVKMKNKLKMAEEEEKIRREKDMQNKWISDGLAKFSEILRDNNDEVKKLAEEVLVNLIHYVDANVGAIYLTLDMDEEEGGSGALEMIAAYAYDRKKHLHKTIKFGEGLVGTCAVEKDKIYLTDLPEDYLKIRSGLGNAKPRSLLFVPLKVNEEVLGVLELASIEELPKYKIDFVEKLSENLGATLKMVKVNSVTKELLEQSRQQAEELATQEEEMRQNLEELQTTQEELARQKEEMESLFKAIKSSELYAEIDINGKFLFVNEVYKQLFGVDNSMFIYDVIGEDRYNEIIKKLRIGKKAKVYVECNNKNNLKYVVHIFLPVLDSLRNVKKIVNLATDVSDLA